MTTTELLALRTRQIEKRPEDLAYAAEILKLAFDQKPNLTKDMQDTYRSIFIRKETWS
jgi:hypothetical protein